jgi:hypothetical protein
VSRDEKGFAPLLLSFTFGAGSFFRPIRKMQRFAKDDPAIRTGVLVHELERGAKSITFVFYFKITKQHLQACSFSITSNINQF